MSRKYKSAVFKSEYIKLLDNDGTKQLETDFNSLQTHLEVLKQEQKKLSPEKGEGDADLKSSPNRWGSANKDETYKRRRLKQQSRKILGREVDFGNIGNVKILKPSPPKKDDVVLKNQSKHQVKKPKANPISEPESLLKTEAPVFSIVTVSFEDTMIEFETNQNGNITLLEVQRYAPQAVGLCYITDDGKKRVLPVTRGVV